MKVSPYKNRFLHLRGKRESAKMASIQNKRDFIQITGTDSTASLSLEVPFAIVNSVPADAAADAAESSTGTAALLDGLPTRYAAYIPDGSRRMLQHTADSDAHWFRCNFYALIYTRHGQITVSSPAGKLTAAEGEILFFREGTLLQAVCSPDYDFTAILVSPRMLRDLLALLQGLRLIVDGQRLAKFCEAISRPLLLEDGQEVAVNARAFCPSSARGAELLFDDFRHMMTEPCPNDAVVFMRLLLALADSIAEAKIVFPELLDRKEKGAGNKLFLDAARLLINTGGRITPSEAAEKLHYSRAYLSHIVKLHTGISFQAYRSIILMETAASMIRNESSPITTIARSLGFSNRTQFYRLFQRHFGCTPIRYRELAAEGRAPQQAEEFAVYLPAGLLPENEKPAEDGNEVLPPPRKNFVDAAHFARVPVIATWPSPMHFPMHIPYAFSPSGKAPTKSGPFVFRAGRVHEPGYTRAAAIGRMRCGNSSFHQFRECVWAYAEICGRLAP